MSVTLIFGAAGFVAQTLIPRLAAASSRRFILVDVHPISSNLRSRMEGTDLLNIQSGRLAGNVEIDNISEAICLAGATSVDAALSDPASASRINTEIAIDFAEWLRVNPGVRALYMSSDEVLGPSDAPLPDDAPLRPSQPYAASKAAAELILHTYREVYGLSLVTLRSCNLIGRTQRPPKLIPNAVQALLSGRPVPIHGNGHQRREWLTVEDLCEAIEMLIRPGVSPGIYQAASGDHRSVLDVVAIVANALSRPLHYEHVPDRKVQDFCYAMQPTRLQSLGWTQRRDVTAAIVEAAVEIAHQKLKDPFEINPLCQSKTVQRER